MTQMILRSIIASKPFYIRTYRRITTYAVISLSLNFLLLFTVIYTYFNRPEPDFYATNGVTAPIRIKPLDVANDLSNALLPPDPVIVSQAKLVPE